MHGPQLLLHLLPGIRGFLVENPEVPRVCEKDTKGPDGQLKDVHACVDIEAEILQPCQRCRKLLALPHDLQMI